MRRSRPVGDLPNVRRWRRRQVGRLLRAAAHLVDEAADPWRGSVVLGALDARERAELGRLRDRLYALANRYAPPVDDR